MQQILVHSILGVLTMFVGLTVLIVLAKGWREGVEAYHRSRRRDLEPLVLKYAHGDVASLLPALGGHLRMRDRTVLEKVLLDHIQRVRGIERHRLGRALEELGYVEHHLESLKSPSWWRRADGAEKLGLAGVRRANEGLVAAMGDDVPEVRIRAAKALGAVGGKASAVPLIEALKEPNRWSTIRVADILAGMGRDVVEELMEAFPDLGPAARLAVLDILGRIRSLDAVPWLRERLGDADPDVRARACHALGSIGDPGSTPALRDALAADAWPVRAMAAKALGRMHARDAIADLCLSMRDREWWVRANAAEALRMMGDDGIEALDIMLDDEDTYARHQAVIMLQETGELDRRVGWLALDEDPDRDRGVQWVRRLIRVGQTARLRELARSSRDPKVRERLEPLLRESDRPTDGEGTR